MERKFLTLEQAAISISQKFHEKDMTAVAAARSWVESTPEWMSQPAGCMSTRQHLIIF